MWSISHYSRRLIGTEESGELFCSPWSRHLCLPGWAAPLTVRTGLTSSLLPTSILLMAGRSVLRPRKCSQPRNKSCPENSIFFFCEKLLVRRKIPGWNLCSTQSPTFLNFSDIGCDELSPWRGLCKYCLTGYTRWALQYATEIEVEGLGWHEMPMNTSSSERPSSQTWQGQQRGSIQYNMVVQLLQGSWLQLPLTEDGRPGRAYLK